uniref:Uncharacterized protein n=1 Tax=Mimivirus LCMiAC01 TaxID=2506608 RepID=A0A481Z1Y1_9VIRU|nr:MAG: hypothetical protein LCMiAC01_04560 [Mimivirus LCMiAC01]
MSNNSEYNDIHTPVEFTRRGQRGGVKNGNIIAALLNKTINSNVDSEMAGLLRKRERNKKAGLIGGAKRRRRKKTSKKRSRKKTSKKRSRKKTSKKRSRKKKSKKRSRKKKSKKRSRKKKSRKQSRGKKKSKKTSRKKKSKKRSRKKKSKKRSRKAKKVVAPKKKSKKRSKKKSKKRSKKRSMKRVASPAFLAFGKLAARVRKKLKEFDISGVKIPSKVAKYVAALVKGETDKLVLYTKAIKVFDELSQSKIKEFIARAKKEIEEAKGKPRKKRKKRKKKEE